MSSLLDSINIRDDDDYSIPLRNEIAPGLWLGCHPYSIEPDLKYVLSLNGIRAFSEKTHQRIITTFFDDCVILPAEAYLYSLADLGLSLWRDGPILVHCTAGMNRSGLIVGLMLVRSGIMTAKEAVDTMRLKRSNSVLHNPVFRKWLLTQ